MNDQSTQRGRGASDNPANRFEAMRLELEPDAFRDDEGNIIPVRTRFFRDDTQSIIAWNNSPDIPFRAGISPYRGCEHGCAYCFARPSHEYLGFSAGLDFETKIMIKERAPELLRETFLAKHWQPQPVAMSGNTDVYQPAERKFQLTRRCLEVFAEFRNPVAIITKNHLVTRDADLLVELARWNAVSVAVSLTTLDAELARELEPRASSPMFRLEAIRKLSAKGVPVVAMIAPVIPGLNDHEIPALIKAAAEAGACDASYGLLRLPLGVKDIFSQWLEEHRPGHKEKIFGRLRSMRGGKLYDAQFGKRMRGEGFFADQIKQLFKVSRHKANFSGNISALFAGAFRRPSNQLNLFED